MRSSNHQDPDWRHRGQPTGRLPRYRLRKTRNAVLEWLALSAGPGRSRRPVVRGRGGTVVRLLNGNLTGAPPCYPTEIEHVAPATAAPAPEPLSVVTPRAVDAQRRPVIVVERAQGGPAAAPVEAHGHPTGCEQVRDVDPLPECCPEIVVRGAHETRIMALRSAGTASGDDGAVVSRVVRHGWRDFYQSRLGVVRRPG